MNDVGRKAKWGAAVAVGAAMLGVGAIAAADSSVVEVDNRSSESIQGSVLELSSYTERSFNLAPGARTDLKWDGWYHEYVYNLDGESPNVVRFQSRFPNRDYLSNDITITYFDGDDGVEHEIECGEPCYWP
ncbi:MULTISPECIES: hypothetical protein [unclassified Thioalkalivibrio]|uniref:hypothetical protein n=1 Tax=unclassified Thioalkalivibrio TaxID=2621013 RepID=UPI00036B7A01|nr:MULTISPECIES: hypothetical protein [unclassified Thioalkalivibrio]